MDSNSRTYACNRELAYYFMCDNQLTNFLVGLGQAVCKMHQDNHFYNLQKEVHYSSVALCIL
jgi:hypothetical protein